MENNNSKKLVILGETSPEWYINILRKDNNSVMGYILCALIFVVCFMIKAIAVGIKATYFMTKKVLVALLDVYKKDEE